MKKTLAIALAVIFVLAFATPAFAQYITHTVKETYEDATIDIERQAGHLCNTGAALKYSVKGSAATFTAERTISQWEDKITVSKDDAEWVAGATPLTVTSVIELCMPAKHEYTNTRYVYDDASGEWVFRVVDSGVMPVWEVYHTGGLTEYSQGDVWGNSVFELAARLTYLDNGFADFGAALDEAILAAQDADDWLAYLDSAGLLDDGHYVYAPKALTKQLWAVQVQSDPGFSGELHQEWEATNGPWNGVYPLDADGEVAVGATLAGDPDMWGYVADDDYGFVYDIGEDFVGMYFNIDQHARTSQGTLKRFIDISSPFSHAYMSEDMTVVGKGSVEEAFSMTNLGPGSEIATLWYELF